MMTKVCVLLVVLFSNIQSLLACNGYTYKLLKAQNCDDNSVIKIQKGFNVIMDKDCNFILSGCFNITKPIKTATGSYSFKKAPLPPIEASIDFCEDLKDTKIAPLKQAFDILGIQGQCPIPAKAKCAAPNRKVNVAQFKNQLSMLTGTTTIVIHADHDSDEPRFCLYPDSRSVIVWRGPGGPERLRHRQGVSPYGRLQVMMWAGIIFHHRTVPVFVEGTLNQYQYIDRILEPIVLPFATAASPDLRYMQDNERPHTAATVRAWFDNEKYGCAAPNRKINLAQYKSQMSLLAGTSTVIVKANHDSGKTCAEISFSLTKPKRG